MIYTEQEYNETEHRKDMVEAVRIGVESDADVLKAFNEADHPRTAVGQFAPVATLSNETHEAVWERGTMVPDGPAVNRVTIRPIGAKGGDVYHLTDAQQPQETASKLMWEASERRARAAQKLPVEQLTIKKAFRRARTVLMKVTGESEKYLSGRECDEKGNEFGPERTVEKRNVTVRKSIPVRYDQKTPSPAQLPQMTMPEQLRHLSGTAEDPSPAVQPDEFGRFPVDPTLRELRTPDRSTYEQGVSHDFKEAYLRNDVRGADKRKQDLPSA